MHRSTEQLAIQAEEPCERRSSRCSLPVAGVPWPRTRALEDNVRLYHIVNGKRRQFAGWNGKVASQTWHTLAVEARGDRFQVFFDRKPVMDTRDETLKEAGTVGLWTKADSVTHFDGLSVRPLQ